MYAAVSLGFAEVVSRKRKKASVPLFFLLKHFTKPHISPVGMRVTRRGTIHTRPHGNRFLFVLGLFMLLQLRLPLHFKPLFLPFPHPYWLNRSSKGRFAPQVTLPSPTPRAVLRTGADASRVAEVWAPALCRSAAVHPANFIKRLVDNNGSLNPLGKCMELRKSLIITVASETASVNTRDRARAEASLCDCVPLPANPPASGPGRWQYCEDGKFDFSVMCTFTETPFPRGWGSPAAVWDVARARPSPDCQTSELQNSFPQARCNG